MEGRTSHHVRAGWFSPWQAGWINLKAMFVFGADFFLWGPGLVAAYFGSALLAFLAWGPVTVSGVGLSLNTMLFALVAAVVGLQMVLTAIVASAITDGQGARRAQWLRLFDYTRTTIAAAVTFCIGIALIARFVVAFMQAGYVPGPIPVATNHLAVIGLALVLSAVLVFTNMLVLHAASIYAPLPATRVTAQT
jgi:hypothetical protein